MTGFRSMKLRYALGLLLLACLAGVMPLAYASPPDPSRRRSRR